MLSFNPFSSTVIVALFDHMSRVAADCECGYRVSSSSSQIASLLFTEALQTDFRKLSSLNDSKDWGIKQVSLDAVPDMGRLGRIVEDQNIILNATGLQLIVRSTLVDGDLVSTGQTQSTREDIRFGSFRAYMQISPINGTCAASFWYHNDTQEIDIELLSRQQRRGRHPINFSIHSEESAGDDDNTSNTTSTIDRQLGFDPAKSFHEYRYDWSQEAVNFYMDGKWTGALDDFLPTASGYVQLSHWSNGFKGWSSGPPSQDALMTVAYFVGYFNSTDPDRIQDYQSRCGGGREVGRVCNVAEVGTTSSVTSQGFSILAERKLGAVDWTVKYTYWLVALFFMLFDGLGGWQLVLEATDCLLYER